MLPCYSALSAAESAQAYQGLTRLDFGIIIGYLAASVFVGVLMSRRARKSLADFFASGGKLPWYLLGTSMIATSFAADTPLALSGMVYSQGISGNWYWWSGAAMALGGVFFFARLWKRANLVTDNEFVALRYSGRPAKALRGFRALYFSLVYACIVLGWVNLAMVKIIGGLVSPDDFRAPAIDQPVEAALRWTGFAREEPILLIGPERAGKQNWRVEIRQTPKGTTVSAQAGRKRAGQAPLTLENPRTVAQVAEWLDGLEGLACEAPTVGFSPATTSASRLPEATLDGLGETPSLETLGARHGKSGVALPRAGTILRADVETRAKIDEQVLTVKILLLLFLATIAYCAIGGLWGVVVTDFFQFVVAMAGSIYLAWVCVAHFGGLGGMVAEMRTVFGTPRADAMLAMVPPMNQAELQAAIAADPGTFGAGAGAFAAMTFSKWLMYVLVVWYALGFTDGGSYLAQRMIAARSERDAAVGYLWYGVGHFCVRMWPWLLVGAAGACLFPTLAAQKAVEPSMTAYDPEMNYIFAMRRFLGPGLLGVMVASFLAAYMSTISTHANLAAGYLVNDFYKPFVNPGASDRRLVWAASFATAFVALVGAGVTLFMNSIMGAWFLLASINAGIGIVYILRWYWWRINAWSEIACFASVALATLLLHCASWGAQYEKGLSGPAKISSLQLAYYRELETGGTLAKVNAKVADALTFEWDTFALVDAEGASSEADAKAAALYKSVTGKDVPEGKRVRVHADSFSLAAFPYNYLLLVPFSMLCWVSATLLTRPVDREHLKAFYRRTRPGGPGWRSIAAECPEVDPADSPLKARNFFAWGLAAGGLYAALFGFGNLVIGEKKLALGLLAAAAACGFGLWRHFEAEAPPLAEDEE